MTITRTRSLSLSGELDMASEPDLLLRITALAEPGTTVELDLSGVTFMDSSALRGLVNAQWDAQGRRWGRHHQRRLAPGPTPPRYHRSRRPVRAQRDIGPSAGC